MQSTNIPTKIPLPFANSAGAGYITAIPVTSQIGIVDGRASLHDGFPPLNFTAISSGGIPPFGADVNGILFESTAILQWQQAGGFFPYDSAFSAYVGGYPKGAVIQAAAFSGFWTSTAENNTTNPDTGGAGWTPTAFSGLQSIPLSGASVTLTNLQSAAPIIVLTGAITQNCNVIVSNFVGDWIFVNNTTGAYTVQVKTAAGTGVNIAQNASQFIWGDATNIYYANASSVTSFNTRTGAISLTALDVTDALGYTPYDASNPNNYGPPIGTIIQFSGTSSPTGYLACPIIATTISRSTYAALFSAIGTTWGAGNGTTTFNMPYFPDGYSPIAGTVGSATIGAVISHTHATTNGGSLIGTGANLQGLSGGSSTANVNIANTGGAANFAAGIKLLFCVKY